MTDPHKLERERHEAYLELRDLCDALDLPLPKESDDLAAVVRRVAAEVTGDGEE